MKKNIRTALFCALCWAAVLAVCFGLLCAAAAIPTDSIRENLIKCGDKMAAQEPHGATAGSFYHSIQDNYADAVLLGVAANMQAENPAEAALDTKYFDDGYGPAVGIRATLEGKEADNDYTRYWHGSLVLVRPMLLFTDISGVRIILTVLIVLLLVGDGILMVRKKHTAAFVILAVSMLMVQSWFVSTTIEYMSVFIIMLAVLPLYVKFANNARALAVVSAGVGTLTAFADFLTAETLTILVPLTISFFVIAEKGEKPDTKKSLKMAASSMAAWGACYLLTFAAKWLIASAVLGRNVSDLAMSAAAERVGGLGDEISSPIELLFSALGANLTMLSPVSDKVSVVWSLGWIALFAVICVFIYRLDTRKLCLAKTAMIIIAALPVVRFCVLMNHSYLHNFFTYRALMASIMAMLGLVWYRMGGSKRQIGKARTK